MKITKIETVRSKKPIPYLRHGDRRGMSQMGKIPKALDSPFTKCIRMRG